MFSLLLNNVVAFLQESSATSAVTVDSITFWSKPRSKTLLIPTPTGEDCQHDGALTLPCGTGNLLSNAVAMEFAECRATDD